MELQPLIVLKEAAASMAIEWFRKMAEERYLDTDAVKRIDCAFKIHATVCKELEFLGWSLDTSDWQEELISIAGQLEHVMGEHGIIDDRLVDAQTRLLALTGKGGAV